MSIEEGGVNREGRHVFLCVFHTKKVKTNGLL
jgi:hypothetical protein